MEYIDNTHHRRVAILQFKYYTKLVVVLCIIYMILFYVYDPTTYKLTGEFTEHYIYKYKEDIMVMEIHTTVDDMYPAIINCENSAYSECKHSFIKGEYYSAYSDKNKNGALQLTNAPSIIKLSILSMMIGMSIPAIFALKYILLNK